MPQRFNPISVPQLADMVSDASPGTRAAMKELEKFLYSLGYSSNQGQDTLEDGVEALTDAITAEGDDFLEWAGI